MAKEKTPGNNENKIKKIDFLKVVGANPDRKINDIAKDFQMSSSAAYNLLNEFILNAIWSDEDKDYPARVLRYFNKEVSNPDEQLNSVDVEQLRHYVDEYYEKHLPGGNLSKQATKVDEVQVPSEIHEYGYYAPEIQPPPQPNYNNPPPPQYNQRPMSYNQPPQQPFNQEQYKRTDMTTDSGFLRSLLLTAKFVHPSIIDRFIQNYEMNKEVYDRDPSALVEVMRHMFGAQQGEVMWKIFQRGRGKFVVDTMGNLHPNNQMDPTTMMMFMQMMNGQQGGGMNPIQMMPLMQGLGSQGMGQPSGFGMDPNQLFMWMMMSQMGQKTSRDAEKQAQMEQMDKLIQVIMLKMVGGSMEDKKPWDMMYGNPMMGGMMGPPQIQEVLDASGRVTQRNIVPSFGMMGQQGQQHDSILTAVLNNTMNTNTQLLMKLTDVGKTPTDILMSMIPYFKDSGNASLQLTNMIKTMNEIAPGFFTKGGQGEGQNLEIAKLKFDTDLAMSAQRMELEKMAHTWRIDEMDRKANNENAQNWMHMIESLGGSFSDKIAPALLEGLGKGSLGGGPQKQPPLDPQQMMMRQQQENMRRMREMQREEKQEKAEQERDLQIKQAFTQQQNQAQTEQQQMMFYIQQLQAALQKSQAENQYMAAQIKDIQSVPTRAYQGGGTPAPPSDQELVRLTTGQLQQMYQELKTQNQTEAQIAGKIESILSNRSLMGQQQPPSTSAPEPQYTAQDSIDAGSETEEVSSQDTKGMEEHFDNP